MFSEKHFEEGKGTRGVRKKVRKTGHSIFI